MGENFCSRYCVFLLPQPPKGNTLYCRPLYFRPEKPPGMLPGENNYVFTLAIRLKTIESFVDRPKAPYEF
jgi:hypothetical protein